MINLVDIYWVAAILEGEGNFRYGVTSPAISLQMSDLDVIEKFRAIVKLNHTKITVIPRDGYKTQYNTSLYGILAIQWMMTIYSIMSIRRKGQIKNVLCKWRDRKFVLESSRKHNRAKQFGVVVSRDEIVNNLIKLYSKVNNISLEEAGILVNNLNLQFNTTVQ